MKVWMLEKAAATGLITYMRTDSTNIAEVAQARSAPVYRQTLTAMNFLPDTPPQYKTRAVGAQEAHEAIRPTSVLRLPEKVKKFLTGDQFKLYQLIWQRFVASQMEAAVYDTLTVEVDCPRTAAQLSAARLRLGAEVPRFPGGLRRNAR